MEARQVGRDKGKIRENLSLRLPHLIFRVFIG